jgi:hypothetical protein
MWCVGQSEKEERSEPAEEKENTYLIKLTNRPKPLLPRWAD